MVSAFDVLVHTGIFKNIYIASEYYLYIISAFTLIYILMTFQEERGKSLFIFLFIIFLIAGGILFLYYIAYGYIAYISELRYANKLGGISENHKQEYFISFKILAIKRATLFIAVNSICFAIVYFLKKIAKINLLKDKDCKNMNEDQIFPCKRNYIKGIIILFLVFIFALPRVKLFMGNDIIYSIGFPFEMLQFHCRHNYLGFYWENVPINLIFAFFMVTVWGFTLFNKRNFNLNRLNKIFLNISFIASILALFSSLFLLTSIYSELKTSIGISLFRIWFFSSLISMILFISIIGIAFFKMVNWKVIFHRNCLK